MPEIELSMDFDVAGDRMAEKEAKTRLLELPEDILHQIMSLLPTTTDVIAIGLSSKTLISVLRSFQLTSMDFRHPKIRRVTKDTTEEFLNFMNGCITALEKSNTKTCPKRFRLQAPFKRLDTDSRIENAIGFAVRKGAKELDIDVGVFSNYYSCYRKPHYPLPVQVIITHPSNSITTLNFKGLCIPEGLNELILACPHIKKVDLTGCSLPSCTRFSSNTLESIHLAHIWSAEEYGRGLLTIEVKSPNLQNFVLSQGFSIWLNNYTFIPIMFSRKCNFLKVLSLEKSSISDQWVDAYVSELVHLEALTLKECEDSNNLRISNHHKLRRIELLECDISQSIEIRVVHLESLTAHNRWLYFGTFKFDMKCSKNLKHLDICGYSLTQEFLEREISQLTSIESLILNGCFLFPIIKILQPNITSLELLNCKNYWIKQIHVDTQRLVSFIYSGDIIPLRVDCSEPFLEATMSTSSDGDPNFKLRTWFEFFGQCKTAKLVCKSYTDFTLPRKFRQKFTAPLSGLRRLTLEIGECSWSRIRRDLIENMLWLYPDLEALHITYRLVKENRRYGINVPCHDPKQLATFLEKIRDDDPA